MSLRHSPSHRALRAGAAGALGLLALHSQAAAQGGPADDAAMTLDTITVTTPNTTPTDAAKVGSALSVVTAEELKERQIRVVADALRTLPGVSLDRSGSFGNITQVRIRGAESNQTLVLIDGVEVNDPALENEFDFGHLLAYEVERIEVLRGPQSALYGSDAIGGVVNIVTKRGEGRPRVTAEVEGGSFGTAAGGATLSGGGERYDFLVSGSGVRSDGISSAAEWRGNPEDDGYENLTGFAKAGVDPTDWLRLDVVGRLTDFTSEYDDYFTQAFDADFEAQGRQAFGRGQATVELFDGRWQHIVGAAHTAYDTDYFSYGSVSAYEGRRNKLDYQTNLFLDTPSLFDARHTFTFKTEHERESLAADTPFVQIDRAIEAQSYIGQYQLDMAQRLFVTAAIRHDDNDFFDDATTHRVTGAYLVRETGTKIRASYGTGVKNPTLFQLYGFTGNFVGNPNLAPEEGAGWDVGVEQGFLDDRVTAGATYFEQRITNLIVGAGATAINLPGEAVIDGVELALSAMPADGLTVTASYTYMQAEDATGAPLVRRPEHAASLGVNYAFLEGRANVNLGISHVGDRPDTAFDAFFTPMPVTLDAYTVVDVAASYQVTDNAEIFGRIENLFDERYEEVFSYGSPGRAAYAGVRVGF